MYHYLLIPCLALSALAGKPPVTDKGCFDQNYNSSALRSAEPAPTSDTFEIRVAMDGKLMGIFDISDLYTLKKDEVLKVNASSLSIATLCVMFHEQLGDSKICTDSSNDKFGDERNLFVVYNGTMVCAAMEYMEIKITTGDNIPDIVPKNCNFQCLNAVPDGSNMNFPFYHWIVNVDGKAGDFSDTLMVKAGSGSNAAAIVLVLCASFLTILF